MKFIFFILLISFISGCDCQRQGECEWKIEVDSQNQEDVQKGFVNVCIRNYTINKQKCFIHIEEEKMKEIENLKFRYKDIHVDYSKSPRKITNYQSCQ